MRAISIIALSAALLAFGQGAGQGAQNTGIVIKPRTTVESPRTDADRPSQREETRDEGKDEPKEEAPAADEPPDGGDEPTPEEEPDCSSPQLPAHRDPSVYDGLTCVVWNDYAWIEGEVDSFAIYTNAGNEDWPVGTVIRVTLPGGAIYDLEILNNTLPGGNTSIMSDTPFPAEWVCNGEIIYPWNL